MKTLRSLLKKPTTYVVLASVFTVIGVSADEAMLAKVGAGVEAALELIQPSK